MNYKECILKEEAEFPKLYASYVEKEFGIMFYMDNNKNLHDGNHAILYPESFTAPAGYATYKVD